MSASQVWTETRRAELRALWASGLTTVEIGRIMGITKNSVIGQVHRLGLPSRPSPIKGLIRAPRSNAIKAEALALCRSGLAQAVVCARLGIPKGSLSAWRHAWRLAGLLDGFIHQGQRRKARTQPRQATIVRRVEQRPRVRVIDSELRGHGCRFPEDVPDGIRFCGATIERGSYCASHAARCYIRVAA